MKIFLAALSIFYLLLALKLPISINAYAGHDDALFLFHGFNILSGHWLGNYNNLTLAKGPGWPIFMSFNAALGFPITLSLALLYLFACYFVSKFLFREGVSKNFVLLIFVLILFHPVIFPIRASVINIYPALVLISFFGLSYAVFASNTKNKNIFILGLFLGLFVITREEWLWIIPGLLIIIFFGYLHSLKVKLPPIFFFKKLTFFFGASLLVISSVSSLNYYNYKIYQISDFNEKEFSSVLKNLNSIIIKQEIAYAPVPKEKRELAYRVSPTFSELRDYLEDPKNGWKSAGCQFYPQTCGDYAGGWFMWALRDGAASKGYYQNASSSLNFYKKVNNEIIDACNQKIINCNFSFIPFMPNISHDQFTMIPKRFFNAIKMVIYGSNINLTAGESIGPIETLNKMYFFLGNPMHISSQSDVNNTYKKALSIKNHLIKFYSKLMPVLFFLGLLSFFASTIFTLIKKLSFHRFWVLSLGAWVLISTRLLILVLIDISSFPALDSLYSSVVYPLLIIASLMSIVTLNEVLAGEKS